MAEVISSALSSLGGRRTALGVATALLVLAGLLVFLSPSNALLLVVSVLLAGALVIFPELTVYLLVFAVPFGSLLPFEVGGATCDGGRWTAGAGVGAVSRAVVARRRIELRAPPLALPFILFILAAAMSMTVARSFNDSAAELIKWVEMLAAYWLVSQFFDETRVERLLAVMFCRGTGASPARRIPVLLSRGTEGFLLFGGANLRAYGTFEQPNPYAGYLGLILPLALGTGLGISESAILSRIVRVELTAET